MTLPPFSKPEFLSPAAKTAALAALLLGLPVAGDVPAPSPTRAVSGAKFSGMDPSVKPGNDFYGYANGEWMKATEIPADRSRWGVFSVLAEQALGQTRDLLEEAAKTNAAADTDVRKVADFYATYMDEAAIDALGLTPLTSTLGRISALKNRQQLSRLLGEQLRTDVDPLNNTRFHTSRVFGLWVSPDFNEPTRYAAYLFQGGIGLPDRAYYVETTPRMADIRAKYQAHVAAVFTLAGIPDATAKAARVLALEEKMAKVHASREESNDVLKANNPWKRSDFATHAPGLDWKAFFAAAGLDRQPMVIVWHPRAIAGLSALVASEPLSTWKEYLTFHAIDRHSGLLPKPFVAELFAFYGKTLTGTPKLSERWKRAVSATNVALGDAVGQMYVKKYFPPEAKAQVQAMVKNIIAAFGHRIDNLDWMAPQTKAKAKEKLSTLYVGVGYPERWIDYSALSVIRGEALENAERAELFEYHRRLAQLGQAVDTTEWWMTPQTVNAVNLPLQNALNFPAAILRPPFFDPAATAAVNYGGIGSTIGHEVSHTFDDQGSQFDAHGRLTDWWTPEDLAHFKASGTQLAAQFDAYHPFPDLAVHGRQTLSENIADLAGLSATHDAWRLSLGGKVAPPSESFSGEQQFFLSFGQIWRSKSREPALRQQVITDGHAPDEYRADTVRNLDAWYPAFEVQPGQALYLAPKDRVVVW
jgi:putative endopeptidase